MNKQQTQQNETAQSRKLRIMRERAYDNALKAHKSYREYYRDIIEHFSRNARDARYD